MNKQYSSKTSKLKILVTDGNYKNALAVIRSLGIKGHDIYVLGGKFCLGNLSKFSKNSDFTSSNFGWFGSEISNDMIEDLILHINTFQYDLIIPVGGNSVKLFSQNRSKIEKSQLFLPEDSSVSLALDKRRSAHLANSIGIKTPKEYKFNSLAETIEHISDVKFPAVIKSSNELQKFPTKYFHNKETLIAHLKDFEATRARNDWSFPIIQQYIEGDGVGYFGVFNHGSVISYFMHKRIRENPPSGGASTCAKSIYLDDLESQGRRLLEQLNWTGPAMVEFKLSKSDGMLYLMEINPKLWGSLDLAISSGVDIPADIVSLLGSPQIKPADLSYLIGRKFSWPFDGEILHIIEKPSSFFNVLMDSLRPSVKNNLKFNDIKPAILSFIFSIRAILKFFLTKIGLLRLISLSRKIGLKYALIRLWTETSGIPIKRYSRITDFLYVGQQHKDRGIKVLKDWGIKHVISLRAEYDDMENDLCFCNYSYLPVVEFQPIPLDVLQKGATIIEDSVKNQEAIYIHCAEGVSRAPSIAAAYLVSVGMSLDEAISLIKKNRPFINILEGQLDTLRKFEKNQNKRC